MMQRREYSTYYFIGIGGIGMSALARYVMMQAKKAYGYDATRTELCIKLEEEGASIIYTDTVENLPALNAVDTLVVYTPAVGANNKLLKHFTERGFTCIKRAKFLGYITEPTVCLAVAGTHGKTTTASILAHLLIDSGKSVSAFLGGITENYKSNFIYRGSVWTVVEADEYDRSFLNLSPSIACITNMDADHLDIYESETAFAEAFKEFGDLVKNKKDLVHPICVNFGGTKVAVGNSKADYYAKNLSVSEGSYKFDLATPDGDIKNFVFSMPGEHNLMNAVMALTMALKTGVSGAMLVEALSRFEGIDRRFSFRLRSPNKVIIEDYAHHPTELAALHQAVKTMYPNEKVALVFQPHLYSRTRDFGKEFAESLSLFDELLLMEIYPARELPILGVNSQWVLDQVTNAKHELVSKEGLLEAVKNTKAKVVVMAGAGDITQEVKRIVRDLENEE